MLRITKLLVAAGLVSTFLLGCSNPSQVSFSDNQDTVSSLSRGLNVNRSNRYT